LIKHNHLLLIKLLKSVRFILRNIIYLNTHHLVYENHNYRMNDISSEWFYDSVLLKYPSVVFKYRSWFDHIEPDIIPDGTDLIQLKQWQISLMIEAQIKAEKSSNENLSLCTKHL